MSQDKNQFPKIEKAAAMREITNNSKNKLASRLYRNSSLNHVNSSTSMLSSFAHDIEPSFLNSSSSNSQLIASISLKKLKKKSDNEPYLSINNGKLLINKGDTSYLANEKSPKQNQKLFKKLDKLSYQPMNKILPDQLIDFPIQKQIFQQSKILKKTSLSPKSQKNRFSQDKEDLLPEDFIQLLEQDKNITNQFCYLKKMDHPYDLKIIQFDKNIQKRADNSVVEYPSEYITISSRGVTYFSEDQSRFVTLQEWKKQANYFKKIIKLDFFKNFKVIKNFSNWKKYLRKTAMKSTVENLKEKLVYNDIYLSKSLLRIKQICYTMETDVSYCRFDDCQKVHDIKQFRAAHEVFLVNQFERKISELEENIKEVLITNMAVSMKQFKEQNKISSSMQGKGMPLLIGDQKNLQMPYTKQATLRTQQQKFQKFIKLVDIIITHSKVNMMAESTQNLAKKLEEDNCNYQRQVICSNYKNTYKGKQYLQCVLTLDLKEQSLFLKPTREDLSMLFQDIVSRSVVRVCRYHKRISSDIDVLSIIYDSQDQFPKQPQSQNLKAIMTSDNRQQQMQKQIMKPIAVSYQFVLKYIEKFKNIAKFHFENLHKMEQIENFQPKHYDIMGNYLQSWHKQKQQISEVVNQHEGALFELSLKQFKEQTEKVTDSCIRKVKAIIPKIYDTSANSLQKQLSQARSQLQNKPTGIKALMQFSESVEKIDNDYRDYEDQRFQLQFLQNLIVAPSNSESGNKKAKKLLHTELQGLKEDLKIAEDYIKAYNIKAQEQVKTMKNCQKLMVFYSQIKRFAEEDKNSNQMIIFLKKKRGEFTEILNQFNNIKIYEKFLNLEESDPTQILAFENYFNAFEKIWTTVNEFETYSQDILQKTCKMVKTSQVFAKIEEFSNTLVDLKNVVNQNRDKQTKFQFTTNDQNALDNTFDELQRSIRPLIETVQCLNETIFGDKEWKQIRQALTVRSPQILRVLEIDKNERKVSDLLHVQAQKQLPFIQIVASKAKRNQQIAKKLEIVKNYTNYTKQHPGLFRNLTERFKTEVGGFLQDIDQKIMMANFVLEYAENNENQKAKIQKNTLEKLKQILVLWDQYEQHVQYFQPIHTFTDWKNTPEAKVYFSATEQNWKKTYKSFKQSTFSKILTAQRIMPSLKQSNQLLQSLYPAVKNYFNSKRQQCPRLSFLSDSQIIRIYTQNKDFKGFNSYINKLFPGVQELKIKDDQILPSEVVSIDGQTLPLKIMRTPNFEVDEMLKSADQFLKNSIKMNLKNCHFVYDTQDFNKQAWIEDNLLQVLVFITNVYFTRIMENDYLGSEGQDKIKLQYYHLSQIQRLEDMLVMNKNTKLYAKISVLLTQALSIRDTINQLVLSQIQSKQSYGWLKQIRSYYNPGPPESASNQYLNVTIAYGNQFVSMKNNPLLMTMLNEKMIVQLVNSMFTCNIIPISANNLLYELSVFNAKPYNSICLSDRSEVSFVKTVIQGTWLTGSFTDIMLTQLLDVNQLKVIADTIHQVQLAVVLKEPYLRGFKNICLNKEAAIALIHPDLSSSQVFRKSNFDYRVFTPQEVSWQAYINLLLEINGLKFENMGSKLGKTINYIENSFSNIKISRNEIKSLIDTLQPDFCDQNSIPKIILKRLNKKQLKQCQKKFLSKLFFDVFGIKNSEKLVSLKSIRDTNVCEAEITRIVSILKENKVVVLAGFNSQFKHFIAYQIRKYFLDEVEVNETRPILIKQDWHENIFGCFRNNKWIDGFLSKKIKMTSNQKQCLIIRGSCNAYLLNILQQLNQCDSALNHLNLSNGDKLKLSPSQKIIFLTDGDAKDPILQKYNMKVIDFQLIKFQPEQVLDYLAKKKKFTSKHQSLEQRYFSSHLQSLSSLQNLYLNNLQKVGNSSLKMLGYRSDYNETNLIMSRFITILNSALAFDKDKACVVNGKMMEKLYIWALYWSIGSCLPKNNLERLDKLFDSIKIQYDKSQSLSESRLAISERNGTISKFIKQMRIFEKHNQHNYLISQEMQAKKELLKMLVVENTPIMLIGDKFSGKSSYIEYLQNTFRLQGHSILKTSITRETKLQNFIKVLKKNSFIQYSPSSSSKKYKVCSRTGKKLVIFVDNFNFIDVESSLFNFFQTATLYNYYFDEDLNQYVDLSGVCFVCAKNGQFQVISKQFSFVVQFFPIYVNSPDLIQIIKTYTQDYKKDQSNAKGQLAIKILHSIATLQSFISNLLVSQKSSEEVVLSYEIPLWIAKQILNCVENATYNTQEMLSLWKYLTVKKYIQSGFAKQFEKELLHQLTNLRTLIVKSANQPETFLKKQMDQVKQVFLNKPTMKLSTDYTDYYCFFVYLLNCQQSKNLISHSCLTPPSIKSSALQMFCKLNSFNYLHYNTQDLTQIKHQKQPLVIYIEGSNINLALLIEFLISQQNTKISFVIDFVDRRQLQQYVRFYPCLKNMAHIYDVKENLYGDTSAIEDYQTVSYILDSSGFVGSAHERAEIVCMVTQNIKTKGKIFKDLLKKRLNYFQKGVKNFKYIEQYLQQQQQQYNTLQSQLQTLQSQQQQHQHSKDSLIQKIQALKYKQKQNISSQSQQEAALNQQKQQLNKSINLVDVQLRKIKNFRKDVKQAQIKIKQGCKEKQEVYALLGSVREGVREGERVCGGLEREGVKIVAVLHVFLEIYYQKKVELLKDVVIEFADKYCRQNLSTTMPAIYEILLNTKIQDLIQDECIIRWHLSNFKSVFRTNYTQNLVQKLQASYPDARQCFNQYDFNQNINVRPIFVKDSHMLGGQQVTMICGLKDKLSEAHSNEGIVYEPTPSDVNIEYGGKMLALLQQMMGGNTTADKIFLQAELKRFLVELANVKSKLYSKIFVQNSQFVTLNNFSQIKQLAEGVTTLTQRISSNSIKIEQIQKQLKQKYGRIIQKISTIHEYLTTISSRYPYTNLTEKQLTQLLTSSITILESTFGNQCECEGEKQSQIVHQPQSQSMSKEQKQQKEVPVRRQLLIDQTINKMENKVFNWVCFNLTPAHSVVACFIFACFKLRDDKVINRKQFMGVLDILDNKQTEVNIKNNQSLLEVVLATKHKKQNKIQLMLDYSRKVLGIQLQNIQNNRQQWLTITSNSFKSPTTLPPQSKQNQPHKLFMLIRSENSPSNVYKLIDRQIRKHLTSEQSIFYILQSQSLEHKIEILEKSSGVMQGWIVLEGMNNVDKINRMIEYVGRNRGFRMVVVFDTVEQVERVKGGILTSQYYQVCLDEKARSVIYQVERILKKYDVQHLSKETKFKRINFNANQQQPNKTRKAQYQNLAYQSSKMLKCISAELIYRFFINLITREQQANAYSYRIFQLLVKRITEISAQDIINFAADFYFNFSSFADRHFFKQAKRIYNKFNIPQLFDDNSTSEIYSYFYENSQEIKQKFNQQTGLKQFCDKFLPQNLAARISIDGLLGQATTQFESVEEHSGIGSHKYAYEKLNNIIQKVPIISKIQQPQKNTSICLQILKTQKKSIELNYSKKIEQIKSLIKILESKRYLTTKTERQIQKISKQCDTVIESLLKYYVKLASLQKLIDTKEQLNLSLCLEYVSRPKEFLYVFLFQNQGLGKIDWSNFGVQAKCISEKQRQILRQPIEKGQYILLNNLKIMNAKYEPHKNYIECIGKGETSRLPNVILFIGKVDTPTFSRRIPLISKDIRIGQVVVISKARQPTNQCPEPYIYFGQKQSQQKQQPKKK